MIILDININKNFDNKTYCLFALLGVILIRENLYDDL